MNIYFINPLIEALRANTPINKVFISKAKKGNKIEEIVNLCRKNKIIFQFVPSSTINNRAGADHQGVFAELAPIRFIAVDDLLNSINSGLLLILDGITDTGNMGAIIRSAVAAEVDGILVSQRNSAPINETVMKASAGALIHAKIAKCSNLANTINRLKAENFWIVAAALEGRIPFYQNDFSGKTAIVMGSEQRGVSDLLRKRADDLIYIPHSRKIESLNVSVATSVILFEALRQRIPANK